MVEERVNRRLAAILAADVAGYTRAMGGDEVGTLAQLQALLTDVVRPAVANRQGRIFKEIGDGILAEFPSAIGAAQCAAAIQDAIATSGSPLQLRIGLHLGDVIVEGGDLFGDGVNIAARLQGEAEPGAVVVSGAFRQHAEGRAGLAFDDLGVRQLKNVAVPVHLFQLRLQGDPTARKAPRRFPRLALPGAALTILAFLTIWIGQEFLGQPPPQASGTPTVAVLPFDNLSQDPEQAFFADGLAEDLITDLSKITGIQVVSRTSSFAVDQQLPMGEISARLNARFIVEGSVRRAGERLRITANLVDTEADTPLWAERFDGSREDVFGFQDEITRKIIQALRVQLTPAERQAIASQQTESPEAYDAYLRGLRLLSARRFLDVEANTAAQVEFEKAIQLDPDFALAYAGLAWTKWLYVEAVNMFNWEADSKAAFELAEKSLALGDNALAHRVLARRHFSLMNYWVRETRKIDLAVAELEAARRLQPNEPDVLADLAIALSFGGRPEEARRLIQTAMERNPNHPDWYFAPAGIAYLLTGEPKRAVRDLKRWSQSETAWNVPYIFLASALGHDGQEADANTALARFEWFSNTLAGTGSGAGGAPLGVGEGDVGKAAERYKIRTTFYAVKRRWPMALEQEKIFLEGLRIAGMKDTPG